MAHEANRKESMGHEFSKIAVEGTLVLTMFAPLLAFAAGRLGFSYVPTAPRSEAVAEGERIRRYTLSRHNRLRADSDREAGLLREWHNLHLHMSCRQTVCKCNGRA